MPSEKQSCERDISDVSKASFRTLITVDPFPERQLDRPPWEGRGAWPCRWVGWEGAQPPLVVAYRLVFEITQESNVRIHVSGDERYELFLDGRRIGRGSERGDRSHWFFETYDLPMESGRHIFVAKVWSLGGLAPVAQDSVRHGFILAPDEAALLPVLGTGIAPWECTKLEGFTFVRVPKAEGAGAKVVMDGSLLRAYTERGEGEGWVPAVKLESGTTAGRTNDYGAAHLMMPATLPAMLEAPWKRGCIRHLDRPGEGDTVELPIRAQNHLADETAAWSDLIGGRDRVLVPAHTTRRVIVDLEDYVCAYPELITSGGAGSTIRVFWAEALVCKPGGEKGNRNELEGKFFDGIGDTFLPGGGMRQTLAPLWWEAGRFLEIVVRTVAEPVILEEFTLRETRYPLEAESSFESSDPRLAGIVPILWRSLQMCAHETYMDCPYYEQMMYAGDTRTEVLTTFALTRESRLPRKALSLFAASRLPNNLTQSRYPSRVTQIIPPFSLWWVAMVHDYAQWRGDRAYIRTLMPVVRGVVDTFLDSLDRDGLVHAPVGWNFMDWVNGWSFGVPPDGDQVSGVINLQFALILRLLGDLEEFCGRSEMALQARRTAGELTFKICSAFWNEERGLLADDLAGQRFSEHAQCLGILGGMLDAEKMQKIAVGLTTANDLSRTSVYFSHYLFEAMGAVGKVDTLLERMEFWFDLEHLGFKTTPETADPTRSECHAWGAHPLFHYFATILGIRPASMGFETVKIRPQLGSLTYARGTFAHPSGDILVDVRRTSAELIATVVLPPGLEGTFECGGARIRLLEGEQTMKVLMGAQP